MSNLDKYLDQKVRSLVRAIPLKLDQAQKERHRIPALALMAITAQYWNGNKYGLQASYPLNPSSPRDGHPWLERDYRGHNIAALAVDKRGRVIDFEFNHNKLFFSSVEHAESRLIRRLFTIAGLQEMKEPLAKSPNLRGCTVYTTLEPCAQCAGIMTLGQVSNVVFLQTDPGMFRVANLLKRMTRGWPPEAPMPINGSQIEMSEFRRLDLAYEKFAQAQRDESGPPFWIDPTGKPRFTSSLTSFLCTDRAFGIFRGAAGKFRRLTAARLAFPDYRPEGGLTNQGVLRECKRFYRDATVWGLRSTPHSS